MTGESRTLVWLRHVSHTGTFSVSISLRGFNRLLSLVSCSHSCSRRITAQQHGCVYSFTVILLSHAVWPVGALPQNAVQI